MRKKQKIIIISLIVIVAGMIIGYASLRQVLNINGTSNITANWDIEITNVKVKETHGNASNVGIPTYNKTTAHMSASFEVPGDYIIYDITVSNLGNLDAVLDSIKMNMPEQDVIEFKVQGITSGDELLVSTNKTFQLVMKYSDNITSDPVQKKFDFSTTLEYLQEGNRSEFSESVESTKDTLSIDSLNFNIEETSFETLVTATNAIKYYYSLDNDKWVETTESSYIFYNLKPYTEYTIYVKAEDNLGNVVYTTGRVTTADKTKPKIQISEGDNVKGNNGWYKGITLNSLVTDNVGVKEVRYCTTTETTCEPTTLLNGTNDLYFVNLNTNVNAQKLCARASDQSGNETTTCSNTYKVDYVEPKISNTTVTPNDDTVTITITSSDNESGIDKYYYSKDGGTTYVESENANYTFTTLEEGDYLINVYVLDKAGNKSEVSTKSTTIKHKSWCEKNGITDLGECAIASEAKNTNIAEAKASIESKGTPDYTVTSPRVTYEQKVDTNTSTFSNSTYWQIGTGYTFNPSTGYYTLTGYSLKDPSTVDYSKGTYYTLGSTSVSSNILRKVTGVTTSTNEATGTVTYTATVYKYTTSIAGYDNSEAGMYAASDDEGTSYYYRGAVGGNYVKFANKYWRIVRVNGDGSVRLIYDGTIPHENGKASTNRQITTKAFNSYSSDNAYVGYMYGDTSGNIITESTTAYTYTGLSPTTKYYFGDKYTFDASTNEFKLAGNLVRATLAEYNMNYKDSNLYTCISASETEGCQTLFRVQKYVSETSMSVKGVTYSSTSYATAHANEVSSTMKTYLDNWYNSNLSSVDDKISKRASFCNNRKVSTYKSNPYTNEGYGSYPTMYGYTRLISWVGSKISPNLECEQINDKFTVSSETGNGKLAYPIGLITADEVSMAGGVKSNQNGLYYLYSGTYYWTMSPSFFNNAFGAYEFYVGTTGGIHEWAYATFDYGVRPVINIDPTKVTFTGTGTMQDPYVVS